MAYLFVRAGMDNHENGGSNRVHQQFAGEPAKTATWPWFLVRLCKKSKNQDAVCMSYCTRLGPCTISNCEGITGHLKPCRKHGKDFCFPKEYCNLTTRDLGSVSCTLIPHGLWTSEELDIGSSTLRWFGTSTFGTWHGECQQCPQCREPTTEVLQESVGAVDMPSLLTTFWAFFPFSHCCTSQRFTSHREFLGFFLVKVKSPKIQERCGPGGRFSNLQCSSKYRGFGGCCAAPGDDEGPWGFHEKKHQLNIS